MAEAEKIIQVNNPYNGQLVGEVSKTAPGDMPAVFTQALEAFEDCALQSFDRFGILNETAALLDKDKEKLAGLICDETGKPIRECRTEVDRAVTTVTWSAQEALRLEGIVQPCDVTPQRLNKTACIHRVPLGIIAAVTPFNFPLNIPAHKIGPALASGNAVILKPSPRAPLSTIEFAEILVKAGLPENLLQVIHGGSEITRELVQGPVRAVSFTGSTSAGQEVSRLAAGKKIIMELGGCDPAVVMDDADLEAAAETIIQHRFGSSGQRCTSCKRAYIQESVYDEMKALIADKVSRLKTGNPRKEDTDVGPLIEENTAETISLHIASAVEGGAAVIAGGNRDKNIFFPTLIENVPAGHPLVTREMMGPVLPLTKFSDLDEVITMVNSTPYGLQSAIFTNRLDVIQRAFREFRVGALIVNDGTGLRVEPLPFGGVKESGTGREGIRYAIYEFTTLKTLIM